MFAIEPQKTRKRLFRRSTYIKTKSRQDELQAIIDEANGFLMKIAELEGGLSASAEYKVDVSGNEASCGSDGGVESIDIEASMSRLDEALAFLRQIAGLDDQPAEHMMSQGHIVEDKVNYSGVDTNVSMKRLDEALAFLREIAGLDDEQVDKLMMHKKPDINEPMDLNARIARTEVDDDDRLWDAFVMERAAFRAVNKDGEKKKKPRGRLARFVGRLFGTSKRKPEK